MKTPLTLFSKKNLLSFLLWLTFAIWAGNTQAQCNVHDHGCQFHSIGATSAHVGVNEAHHTKGTQITPGIEASTDGLYIVGVWDDNASGSKADLDVDALLPDATWDINNNISGTGAFIITNNASRGGADSSSDPFSGIAGEHNRHVSTFQEQITFANATATAIHSQDANGLAPTPPNTADSICNAISADSCEAVQITGNIPTGFYGGAVTNYDVHNLPDPSTPNYNVFAYAKGVKGTLVTLNPDPFISGSMASKGEVSNVLSVFFRNWDFNPHAEGVVLDNYQRHFYGKTKYANPYSVTKGDYFLTYQKRYRDYWGVNYQDTISGQGKVQGTEQKGLAYRNNNVHIGTDFVGRTLTPEARAKIQRERAARERAQRAKELARQMNKYDAGTLTGFYAGPIRPELSAFGDNALVLNNWAQDNPEDYFNLVYVEPAQFTFSQSMKEWEEQKNKDLYSIDANNKKFLENKLGEQLDFNKLDEKYRPREGILNTALSLTAGDRRELARKVADGDPEVIKYLNNPNAANIKESIIPYLKEEIAQKEYEALVAKEGFSAIFSKESLHVIRTGLGSSFVGDPIEPIESFFEDPSAETLLLGAYEFTPVDKIIPDVIEDKAKKLVKIGGDDPNIDFPNDIQTDVISGAAIKDYKTGEIFEGNVSLTSTIERIKKGEKYPHHNDGSTFKNREENLPEKPEGYYTEYVVPSEMMDHVGPQRLVVGKNGEIYYTPNHYDDFIPVKIPGKK